MSTTSYIPLITCLEQSELLLSGTEDLILLELNNIESDSLGQGSALTTSNDITFLNIEARRAMDGSVLMPFLETVVLFDVVKIVATNDDGSGHLG